MRQRTKALTCLEICAGGGGQAIGLAQAGFAHNALIEIDKDACLTLRQNRPDWNVIEADIRHPENFDVEAFKNIDLLAGGVPCPPFSVAGKQLGSDDERDLFPAALSLVEILQPRAIMLENVRGLMEPRFEAYRRWVREELRRLGYKEAHWAVVNACDFGVPQLRPRSVLVAVQDTGAEVSLSLIDTPIKPSTVGESLKGMMGANGWRGVEKWVTKASGIAPTLVGGSKRHGGPDLGPTRAKAAWQLLGVDGTGVSNSAPGSDFPLDGLPKLTVKMAAKLQGFPDDWQISGKKTSAYRQVGNAFPPPVAKAFGEAIRDLLLGVPARTTTQLPLAVREPTRRRPTAVSP